MNGISSSIMLLVGYCQCRRMLLIFKLLVLCCSDSVGFFSINAGIIILNVNNDSFLSLLPILLHFISFCPAECGRTSSAMWNSSEQGLASLPYSQS